MRAVVQRVSSAKVEIGGECAGQIQKGLCVLLGVDVTDTEADADYLCDKLTGLRIFDDENGVPNRSVMDIGGSILLISQFTLLGDARKGRRPSYIAAARPETAVPLYDDFHMCIFRNSDGVMPSCALNCLAKCAYAAYPQSSAICEIGDSVLRRSSLAL